VPIERCSIEEQSIEYCSAWRSEIATYHVTKHNTHVLTKCTVPALKVNINRLKDSCFRLSCQARVSENLKKKWR
jgi:hypothetical protein